MEPPPFQDPNHGGPSGTPPDAQQQQQQQQQQESSPSPAPTPQGPPQLPPQLFTTAAQLLDLTDKKLVLNLRDGRKLIGVLRSWDQFANIVLQEAVERLYVGNLYCEIPRGVYLVRGENVLLLGEVDLDRDDDVPPPFEKVPVDDVLQLKEEQDAKRKQYDKQRRKKLQTLGFEAEHSGEILF